MGRTATVSDIRLLVALLLAVPLEAVTVNPSLCPTNKIAPHKRVANWGYGTGRTFGAFYDLLTPGNSGNSQYGPNYQNDLQEQPQEDDPTDCGEIEDYDENDLSSLTPQGNRRRDHRDSPRFGFGSLFGPQQPPVYPQRPPNNQERPQIYPPRPPNYPQRPPNYPQRPPRPPTTDRPQRPSYPPTRPPYWSGGFFGSNDYRPPLSQNPSDKIKPIHEYSGDNQVTYRPDVIGGPLTHVVGWPLRSTTQSEGTETTTARAFYDRYRTSTPAHTAAYPVRRPRPRNINNDSILGSFVNLLF